MPLGRAHLALSPAVCGLLLLAANGSVLGADAPARFNARGISVRGGVGLSLCSGLGDNPDDERPFGCDSFSNRDLGLALTAFAGWRFLDWGTVEVGYTQAFHEVYKEKGCGYVTRRSDFWYAPRLGLRFHPLGSRSRLEPVLGLHLGYVAMQRSFTLVDTDPETCFEVRPYTAKIDGVQIDGAVGLEVHVTRVLSIGLELTVFENLWVRDTTGSDFEGDLDDVFINLDLLLIALFG